MALSLVTPPATEPLSLAEAKAQLRLDAANTASDGLVTSLILAAREFVEGVTSRALITQTWDWKLDGFPCGPLAFPLSPVTSVSSVVYVDTNGATQTWSSALYQTDLPSAILAEKARLMPAYQQVYPTTRDKFNAVTIRFVAGYGATAASVPEELRHVMRSLIAHWFENREAALVTPGSSAVPLPYAVDRLWMYRVY